MCNGCYKCIMEGEEYCPHYDIINPIMDKIRKCDGIIIGSPVYSMNVTALLKNFFDHTAYLYHRPQFFTKKALVIVTTAGAGQKKVADYIDENLKYWGVNNIYKLHFACGGKDSLEKDKINKTAKKFARDVESKKMHSPKFSNIISYNVWRAMACCDDPIPADKKYCLKTIKMMNKIIVSIVITLVLPKLVKVLAKATLAGFVLQTTLITALSKL